VYVHMCGVCVYVTNLAGPEQISRYSSRRRIWVCMCTCAVCVYVCVCMYLGVYVHMCCVCMCVYVSGCVCANVRYVCMYVNLHASVNAFMRI
jgi:hypothetical protein